MSRIQTSLAEVRQLDPVYRLKIPPDFLDENEHVNVQYYLHLVERGLGEVFDRVDLGEVYSAADTFGNFALEQHIRYLAEILVDDTVCVHIRLLQLTDKRAYLMGFLVNDTREQLAATVELVMMNVAIVTRRGAPFPADARLRLAELLERHENLPWTAPTCGVMSA